VEASVDAATLGFARARERAASWTLKEDHKIKAPKRRFSGASSKVSDGGW
jgi:hypothetical protein